MNKKINVLVREGINFQFMKDIKNIMKIFYKEYPENKKKYVDLLITDNKEIMQISKETRKIEKETDVLSFPFNDFIQLKNNKRIPLGEIIMSYEKIIIQAKENNHSLRREFCFLFAHSLIHLLGYDHKNNKKEEKDFNLKVYNIINKAKIYRE